MCAQIGVIVSSAETPPSVVNSFDTANAFMVGYADWGPLGISGGLSPVISLNQAAAQIGPPTGGLLTNARTTLTASAGNATLYDSADAFFRELGGTLYMARVVGSNPTFGTLVLQDAGAATAMTLTAAYVGAGSAGIYVLVTNNGANYTITLQDSAANVLALSPVLSNTNKKDAIAWALTTNLVTITAGNANLPKTVNSGGNPLSAGSDGRGTATITNWLAAMNSGFPPELGPGQIMAPGQTNTALVGIWSGLASHAQSNNRIALLDGTDGNTASAAVAEVTAAALPAGQQSYCGIWVGNLQIPGTVAGTTRVIPPSPVVAALCARADGNGNPNLAPAGVNWPLNYVSGLNTTYTGAISGDIANMNNAGINVFANVFQTIQNYGFVSALALPTNDPVYWELDHCRLRMAIVAQSQIVGQEFLFSQIDGQGFLTAQFSGALQGMLGRFFAAGALYGANSAEAFTVSTSAAVNTPASLAAGQLNAALAVRMSPFAQLVEIVVNVVPITQQLPTSG